jgi:hypothetical protein
VLGVLKVFAVSQFNIGKQITTVRQQLETVRGTDRKTER